MLSPHFEWQSPALCIWAVTISLVSQEQHIFPGTAHEWDTFRSICWSHYVCRFFIKETIQEKCARLFQSPAAFLTELQVFRGQHQELQLWACAARTQSTWVCISTSHCQCVFSLTRNWGGVHVWFCVLHPKFSREISYQMHICVG